MAKKEKLVEVPIDLDDATFIIIAKMAHEKDITFNKMCCIILKEQMDREEKKIKK